MPKLTAEPYLSGLTITASYAVVTNGVRRVLPLLHETSVKRLSQVNNLKEGATYLSVDPNEAYGTATRDTAFWISFTKQVTQGLGVQCPIPIDSNPPPPEVTGYWLQLAPLQHRDGLELDLPTRAANDQLKGMLAVHKRYEIEAGFLFSLGDEVTAAEGLPPAYDYSDIRHGLVSQHGPVIGQIHYATPDSVFLNWGHTDQVAKRIQRSLDAYQDDSDA